MRILSLARAGFGALVLAANVHAQAPTITGVAQGATSVIGTTIAPGEILNILVNNLADTNTGCGTPTGIPNTCAGIGVTIGGKLAPVRNTNTTFAVVQVPVDLPLGSASIVLTRNGTPSAPFDVTVAPTVPGMFSNNASGPLLATCFSNGAQIYQANAVSPGASVRCVGTGFGVTNPVVPTGTVQPQNPLPSVVASVKVTVGGVNATVTSATLAAGNIVGQDQVVFTVPQTAGGTQPVVVTVGGVDAPPVLLPIVPGSGPSVSSVLNSASNVVAGLPNTGVAPGSIVVVYGKGLGPATLTVAPGYPWPETLSGTSVSVNVNGTVTKLRLYYTSDGQVAGLLPSSTPAGTTGSITVTYNGQTGSASPILVQFANFGIYTVSQNGSGTAIVTFADYSLVANNKAANPGETLILWGTGLGAVTGDEAAGPLPGDMTNLPVQVWVGGKSANVVYRGRSGCCVGEDQVAFVVPSGVSGCIVPIVVQINGRISNTASMAIAASGRQCQVSNPIVDSSVASIPKPKIYYAQTKRFLAPPAVGPNSPQSSDDLDSLAAQLGASGAEVNAGSETVPFGSCTISGSESKGYDPPFLGLLDAGASVSLRGPGGTRTLNKTQGGDYSGHLGDTTTGNFLDPGQYTLSIPGGKDVGAVSVPFTVPPFAWTNKPSGNTSMVVNRAGGLTINWTGGDPNGWIEIHGVSTSSNGVSPEFVCVARPSDGTFTVPPYVLLAMPPSNNGPNYLSVSMNSGATTFSATGIDWGGVFSYVEILGFATFQ